MASGNFSASFANNKLSLLVEWSSTTNVNANTSNVTARLYVKSYSLRATALADSYLTINGNKKNWTKTFNVTNNSTQTTTYVTEHTVTVPHNTNGTKSITIKANFEFNGTYSGVYISDLTVSKEVSLDTIPRSSSFSVPSSINTGAAFTIGITPSSSSFRHQFKFVVDSKSYTSDYIAAGKTSYQYTIPHNWLPSSTSKTMTVYCYTCPASGNGYIAQVTKTTTINVPSNIKPSVTALSPTVYSGGLSGKYIQGKSQVKLTATAKAGDGSTISSYTFKGANISGTSSSYTGTSNSQISSIIQTSGTVTYQVIAQDARGRSSDPFSISIQVYTYAAPQVTAISAQRCLEDGTLHNDGMYAKVTVKTSYVTIDGANTRTVKLYNSKDNYATGFTILESTDKVNTYSGVYGGGFDTNENYVIRAIITDKYSNHSEEAVLHVSERTINIAKYGNGVAIGGLSTVEDSTGDGLFECNWDAKFASPIDCSIDGTLVLKTGKDTTSEYMQSLPTYERTYSASPNVYITSLGTFGRGTSSSQRYKTDIEDVKDSSLNPYKILDIPVRQYKYNQDNVPVNKSVDDLYIGCIAEEVAKAYPIAAEYNEDGQVEMWNIKVIVPAMLKILQDQQKEIQNLKEQLNNIN
jgi:hypothetical protein